MTDFETNRRNGIQRLRNAGIETAEPDAQVLLMHAAGLTREELILNAKAFVNADILKRYDTYLGRRENREPVAYIMGKTLFLSLCFKVGPPVLIPRPETEEVVTTALKIISREHAPSVLDIGTGSGAILISLLKECPDASGLGTDISKSALAIAADNAKSLGVACRCAFQRANFLEKIDGKFDLVISNPPYITNEAIKTLMPDVHKYEPHLALEGGADGLEAYRAILSNITSVVKPGGWVVFEIGYDQGESVRQLMQNTNLAHINVKKDIAGLDRIVYAQFCA